MKSLICYATKRGTTLKCSKIIASKIKNYDLININNFSSVDIDLYDRIFLGTPIYFGKINKKIKKFLNDYEAALLQKDLRIFTIGMDDKNLRETYKRNFKSSILDKAVIKYLGGAYNFEEMTWFEKLIVKKVASFDTSVVNLKEEKIDELVNEEKPQ